MKKFLLSIMMATALSACGDKAETPKENTKPVVKIGVILPLSGNNTVMGESYKNLFLMRLDEVTENSKFKYEIIFEDDQFNIKKEIIAAQKLINIDNVDVVFTSSAGGEEAIADIARGKNTIVFSNLWDKNLPKNNDFFFNYVPTPEQHAEVLAQELKRRNIKNVSTIINNHKGSILSINEFKNYATKYGINIIDGKEGYYLYDIESESIQKYDSEMIELLKQENQEYLYIIYIAGSLAIFSLLLVIILLCSNKKKNKLIKKYIVKHEAKKDISKQKKEPELKENVKKEEPILKEEIKKDINEEIKEKKAASKNKPKEDLIKELEETTYNLFADEKKKKRK